MIDLVRSNILVALCCRVIYGTQVRPYTVYEWMTPHCSTVVMQSNSQCGELGITRIKNLTNAIALADCFLHLRASFNDTRKWPASRMLCTSRLRKLPRRRSCSNTRKPWWRYAYPSLSFSEFHAIRLVLEGSMHLYGYIFLLFKPAL